MISLHLYSTLGCHLCEQAESLLLDVARQVPVVWQMVEIADSDDLIEQYGIRIPVLKEPVSGAEIGWPFDEQALIVWLDQVKIGNQSF